jgi:hypothetical protein
VLYPGVEAVGHLTVHFSKSLSLESGLAQPAASLLPQVAQAWGAPLSPSCGEPVEEAAAADAAASRRRQEVATGISPIEGS